MVVFWALVKGKLNSSAASSGIDGAILPLFSLSFLLPLLSFDDSNKVNKGRQDQAIIAMQFYVLTGLDKAILNCQIGMRTMGMYIVRMTNILLQITRFLAFHGEIKMFEWTLNGKHGSVFKTGFFQRVKSFAN